MYSSPASGNPGKPAAQSNTIKVSQVTKQPSASLKESSNKQNLSTNATKPSRESDASSKQSNFRIQPNQAVNSSIKASKGPQEAKIVQTKISASQIKLANSQKPNDSQINLTMKNTKNQAKMLLKSDRSHGPIVRSSHQDI